MVCQFDIFSYLLTTAAADISTVLRLRPYLGQEVSRQAALLEIH